ncbi:DoxX family protein [Ensifer soli]|uniref:DoxX family protein n=1 Tax=Ciceribacter sp. sgz301302 TaxID=3342379 RepID=UPI0035B9BF98
MATIGAWRKGCRIGLSVFYGVAGLLHLVLQEPFLRITPQWVPHPEAVILLTGICEIAGAVALFVPALRIYAGVALALYAVCVYPANIKHAIDTLSIDSASVWLWSYHVVRLPLQPVIVWLALFTGGAVSWPFGKPPPH